jgi:hypothetical protein|tara:strand:- start:18 stop:218 length:201 start_codon:yes stop_codon:yes gene_type:complete
LFPSEGAFENGIRVLRFEPVAAFALGDELRARFFVGSFLGTNGKPLHELHVTPWDALAFLFFINAR